MGSLTKNLRHSSRFSLRIVIGMSSSLLYGRSDTKDVVCGHTLQHRVIPIREKQSDVSSTTCDGTCTLHDGGKTRFHMNIRGCDRQTGWFPRLADKSGHFESYIKQDLLRVSREIFTNASIHGYLNLHGEPCCPPGDLHSTCDPSRTGNVVVLQHDHLA